MKDREKKFGEEHEKQQPSRIIIESQDGTVSYLEGEEAVEWNKVMDSLVTYGFVHGSLGQVELSSLHWKNAASLQDIPTTEGVKNK